MVAIADKTARVEDFMKTKFLKLSQTTSFENWVMHLGQRAEKVVFVVDDQEHLTGIVTSHELIQALVQKIPKSSKVSDIVALCPPVIGPHDSIERAATILVESKNEFAAVLEGKSLRGLVIAADIQQLLD